jgi:MraZ protein
MLRGSQPATVDAKGRLKIPATFLPELRKYGEEFYVTSESGDFARIYPMKTWEELEAKLAQLPSHNPTKQKFLALTSYFGQVVKMDGQGRVLIPAVLRESAQTTGEVVVLGNQTWLNVWNHSRFLEQHVRSNAWTAEDAKTMGELGI